MVFSRKKKMRSADTIDLSALEGLPCTVVSVVEDSDVSPLLVRYHIVMQERAEIDFIHYKLLGKFLKKF